MDPVFNEGAEEKLKNKEISRIILFCQGGAGDVMAHTPMIRYFRKKYPEDLIIVLSTYYQLLKHNPNIDVLFSLKEVEDFYQNYVLNCKIRFFKKHFVYDALLDAPAVGAHHLLEFVCNVYNAEYDKGPVDYFVTDLEKRAARTFLGQYDQFNLPIVLLHCTGAIPSDGAFNKTNNLKDLNIQLVTDLVQKHKDKALFVHIGLEGEPKVEGAIDALGMQMREAIALIPYATTYIFIESLFAHCTNALGTSGVVVFQNMDPSYFGYPNNKNIWYTGGCPIHPCNRPVGALLDLLPGYRNPKTRERVLWECPDQVCAKMPLENLEEAFLDSLSTNMEKKNKKGNPELEKARKTPPPPHRIVKPTDPPSAGKVGAGDPNLPPDLGPELLKEPSKEEKGA